MKLDLFSKGGLYNFLEGGCSVEDAGEATDICVWLLENLGSPDAELRDGLSFTILAKILMETPNLEGSHLKQVLQTAIDDEHLFYRIGETGSDSVFMRSFSVLVVAAVLERDGRDNLLDTDTVREAIAAVLRYALEEEDKRGYVAKKGWAHSVAHTSDALDSCIVHRYITVEQTDLALDALRHLIMSRDYLVHDEDGRLAETVYRMVKLNRVEFDIVKDWMPGFAQHTYGTSLEPSAPGWNAQNFLRRLYLRLHWAGDSDYFKAVVEETLKSVDPLAIQS
ncbi:DUF2785 domain-containing protein [Alicyclobacillus sp. SO9]|uniref:DUF2785 domain-containing protein n=1 Tax=Alicyclobacillus sp. SO9 TaxID=2665646 RepID=UPI0018E7C170|nr:DUF2785 domain-containing protein [Alicyclobacillus sp. SO9]QQE79356.1 DUF2785 domain-containing protein [Alicyclobacillus sp. SO9]